jgi:multidrug efflux pump subunit AcrA (membrane-fusion protein)
VEEAVQEYVDEVHSKAVAIVPLKEPHDTTDPTAHPKVVGALIIEQIEDSRPRDGLIQRVEVVSDHSAIALTNALEHHELFLMPVWRAIGKSKWVVEARQLPYTISITAAVLLLTLFLFLWRTDFTVSSKGTLEPAIQRQVFAGQSGDVTEVLVKHRDMVKKDQPLAVLRNYELESKLAAAIGNLESTRQQVSAITRNINEKGRRLEDSDRIRLEGDLNKLLAQQSSLEIQLELLREEVKNLTVRSPIDGQIVTWQVRETLINRPVEKGQVMMRVVEPRGDWELELMVPENQMGYVNDARAKLAKGEDLKVDYITAANPGTTYHGKIKEVHRTAEVRGEEGNTVIVRVAIDKADLDSEPRAGAAVTAKVYAGRSSIGYAWFHDLISFFQSKILFRI